MMLRRLALKAKCGVGNMSLAVIFVLVAVALASACRASQKSIIAFPLANAEVLEPSVENEVDHAIAKGIEALSNVTQVGNAAIDGFLPAGLSTTEAALRLVTSQRGDGRWLSGTNDVTFAVLKRLCQMRGDERAFSKVCEMVELKCAERDKGQWK